MKVERAVSLLVALCFLLPPSRLIAQAAPAGEAVPVWLYPVPIPSTSAAAPESRALLRLPRSRRAFTRAQVTDMFAVPDWYPSSHPVMPEIVASGRKPAVFACGYCHLPAGGGRPENAALAGLPVDYFVRQVADMRSGARRNALAAPYRPWDNMHMVALNATDAEVRIAAEYFATLPLPRRVRIVEADRVPRTYVAGALRAVSPGGGDEPLGGRIIEIAEDQERFERRDERTSFIAYVPKGSLATGATLSERSAEGAGPCASCHGPSLRGGPSAPPIAGRSPSYIMRQLVAFKTGARDGGGAAPMSALTSALSLQDMVALSAYVASLSPRAGATTSKTTRTATTVGKGS
jgi:cytochrome c553